MMLFLVTSYAGVIIYYNDIQNVIISYIMAFNPTECSTIVAMFEHTRHFVTYGVCCSRCPHTSVL